MYIDHLEFAAYIAYFTITSFHILLVPFLTERERERVYGCIFCMLLFNFVNYVFLSLCVCILIVMFRYYLLLRMFCSVYCLCVNVSCTTATRCKPNCS
jgi:uncharacterized membrane protein YqjE